MNEIKHDAESEALTPDSGTDSTEPAVVSEGGATSSPSETPTEVAPEYQAQVIGPGDRYPYWVIISSKATWAAAVLLFIGAFLVITPGLPVPSTAGAVVLIAGVLLMAGVIGVAMRLGQACHHVCEPLEDRFIFHTGIFGRKHIVPFSEIVGMQVIGTPFRESLHGGSVVFVLAKDPSARRRRLRVNGIANTALFRHMILNSQQKKHA